MKAVIKLGKLIISEHILSAGSEDAMFLPV